MIWFHYTITIALGLALGSFVNAWVWRVKEHRSIAKGRSMCTTCHTQLTWYDNIPIISYLCLKGACRTCKQPISLQYPIVELVMMCLFTGILWYHGAEFSVVVAKDWYLATILTFVFLYDLKYGYILDRIIFPATAILVILNIMYSWVSIPSMALGILVGAGFFLIQYIVSKGTWIGGGDIRLGVLMGVLLGWQLTILAIFLAYIIGAVSVLILLVFKKVNLKQSTPFGTYLTIATGIALFYGEQIIHWYIQLL